MNTEFLNGLKNIVGEAHVLTAESDTHPYFREYGGRFVGKAIAAVRPADTQQVSDVVKLCVAHNVAIVPQSGNTGLVGGSVPTHENSIVISLARMNKIRRMDADDFSMTVEAGVVLETIQNAAAEAGRYFPLRLGSQGSCQIGGNIATNAGGILTIRYGNTRDLILGLEVVLPDGEIWDGLRPLRKDNTGYALKHLFIGSEGTLGIVTAAVLKLYPDPGARETFFAGVNNLRDAIKILSALREEFGENLLAFEVISEECLNEILKYQNMESPLQNIAPWHLLVEVTGGKEGGPLRHQIEEFLGRVFEQSLVQDAAVAQNEQQRKTFWRIRECASDAAQANPGGSMKHDISVPVFAIPDFIDKALPLVQKILPGSVPTIFGHAGDGNLHFDLIKGSLSVEDFTAGYKAMNHAMHDLVQTFNGSFAAEHGVGSFKAAELAERKSRVELQLMRTVKQALDPENRMNPGSVLL